MDDHFDIGRVFEIGKFDITRLTCISKGLLLFCSYLKIYSFKCAARNKKHPRGRAVKYILLYVLQRVLGSILSDVDFFSFLFFSRFS